MTATQSFKQSELNTELLFRLRQCSAILTAWDNNYTAS